MTGQVHKSIKVVTLLCLLLYPFSLSFGQLPRYQNNFSSPINVGPSIDVYSAYYARMQQKYDELDSQIQGLLQYLMNILSQDLDSNMRARMNKDYQDVRALSNKLHEYSSYSQTYKQEYDKLFARISDEIVEYNNRISQQNNSNYGNDKWSTQSWSGSGFALNDGYVITNHHVIDNAKKIKIKGIRGDFYTPMEAIVVASDKNNDIAILKIIDSRFYGFGIIPYSMTSRTCDVGEEIFVLGYPLHTTMGDEIKYTTGVICSNSGYQGDASLYQFSAPIQPGNSGGPLFDANGNIIGVVGSKHTDAENAGYAIKTSNVYRLIIKTLPVSIIPSSSTCKNMSRTGIIKSVKGFVFLIECNN